MRFKSKKELHEIAREFIGLYLDETAARYRAKDDDPA
jgi:hypothetical protein